MSPSMCVVARVVASLGLLAFGCGSAPLTAPSQNQPVEVIRLRPGGGPLTAYSGMTESRRLVIRDEGTWRQTWASIWRNVSEQPPLPQIDFANEMVVVAALGARSSGGYAILVEGAALTAVGVSVRVRAISPGPACGTTQAVTQPVDAVRLPRLAGTVTFEERSETRDCH